MKIIKIDWNVSYVSFSTLFKFDPSCRKIVFNVNFQLKLTQVAIEFIVS